MEYEHTQSRPQLGALLVLAGIAALGVALWQSDAVWFATSAFLVLLGILGFALSSLTTTVSTGAVVVGFRWGWPRREIPRAQILRAEPYATVGCPDGGSVGFRAAACTTCGVSTQWR